MNKKYPVVIYGASGYTGRLIAEFLREYGIPFIAAGRNRAKLEEAMATVPGIVDAQYEIVEVEHTVEALAELFSGRRVVCNTVGPFIRKASTVIEACLRSKCHYMDTTGEQPYMFEIEERYGAVFKEANLALIPSMSYMYAVSEIAAQMCLETPGIDSLDLYGYGVAVPTQASTESIFDVVRLKARYLKDWELVEYDGIEVFDMTIPGGMVLKGTPWGGTSHPVWFNSDPRVRNCRMTVALSNQDIYKRILELERIYKVSLQWIPEEQLAPMLDKMAATMTPVMPPRESRGVHRSIDWCHGRGNNVANSAVVYGTGGYLMTGALQAYAAKILAYSDPRKVGFASPCEVFGHRELLGSLEAYGLASATFERIV